MDNRYIEYILDLLSPSERSDVTRLMDSYRRANKDGFRSFGRMPGPLLLLSLSKDPNRSIFLQTVVHVVFKDASQTENIDKLSPPREIAAGLLAHYSVVNKLDSEQAQLIVQTCISFIKTATLNREATNETKAEAPMLNKQISEDITNNVIVKETQITQEGKGHSDKRITGGISMLYIGYVQTKNFYYNFHPVAIITDSIITPLDKADAENRFPSFGNINLFSQYRGVLESNFINGRYYAIEFDEGTLETNYRNSSGDLNPTNFKLDVSQLLSQRKVKSLSDVGAYYVVSALEDIDIDASKIVKIKDNNNGSLDMLSPEDQVLLLYKDKLIGPFNVERIEGSGEWYISPKEAQSSYILPCYTSRDSIWKHIISLAGYQYGYFMRDDIVSPIDVASTVDLTSTVIDVISDNVLLKEFCELIKSNENASSGPSADDYQALMESFQKSPFINLEKYGAIGSERLLRLQNLLSDERTFEKSIDTLSETISQIISRATVHNPDLFESIYTHFIKDSARFAKIQKHMIVQDELQKEQEKLNDLIAKRKEEEGKRQELLQQQAEICSSQLNDLIKTQQAHLAELQEKCVLQEQELLRLGETVDNARNVDQLKLDAKYYEEHAKRKENEASQLQQRIDESIANFSISEKIAQKILEAAASGNEKKEALLYSNRIFNRASLPIENATGTELVSILCDRMSKYRSYDKNAIVNLFICLTQGFLTVLSGEPGTGKTSICNIIANVLGLDKLHMHASTQFWSDTYDADRFVAISVERGWTSKRDLIGYYNPLTKVFDKSNHRVYDALRLMDVEASRKSDLSLPYIMLLDEANLSPMEHYWADFMNVCDDWNQGMCINLSEYDHLHVSNVLRFMATINNDHTTETLSPRLIDRAWVISLPSVPDGTATELHLAHEMNDTIIPYSSLEKTFVVPYGHKVEFDTVAKEIIAAIYKRFRDRNINISPRTDRAIRNYWSVAKNYFEKDPKGSAEPSVIALDYAIAQKMLVKIMGNGGDYHEFLIGLKTLFESNYLFNSSNLLDKIIRRGVQNMNYFQFFY